MVMQLAVAALIVLIGIAFVATGTPLCQNDCWLEQVCDGLLPDALAVLSGGLPWWGVGGALAVHTLLVQRK